MKIAVVLFNLGGPDCLKSVQPFLFNLFNDPSIIDLPCPFRWILAHYISLRRVSIAKKIYGHLGGCSPLLDQTTAQAHSLAIELGPNTRVFIAMRYWHPLTDYTVAEVKAYDPDHVILLPLYPQFSFSTTGSSLKAWHYEANKLNFTVPTTEFCSYPVEPGFISAITGFVRQEIVRVASKGMFRVLFSAHGLPKRNVDLGDPYPLQVEQTVAAIVQELALPALDWSLCYQSRVGSIEWIGPSIDAEISRASRDRVGLVVVPVAFVSEHSETLVELDIEYQHLAMTLGVPFYVRAQTVSTDHSFIVGLANMVRFGIEHGSLYQ